MRSPHNAIKMDTSVCTMKRESSKKSQEAVDAAAAAIQLRWYLTSK